MKRNVRVYLQDMHANMLKALEYTEGLDFEAFVEDSKTNYAVVRCLESIDAVAIKQKNARFWDALVKSSQTRRANPKE